MKLSLFVRGCFAIVYPAIFHPACAWTEAPQIGTEQVEQGSERVAESTAERPLAEGMNLLLITVDTLRASNLGVYGYERDTTPALDRWADGAAVFPNSFATSAWTFPGLFSVLTGRYPPGHGIEARGRVLDPTLPTLQSLLRQSGYAVPALSHYTRFPGLEALHVDDSWSRSKEQAPGDALIEWLRSDRAAESPFLAWYHWRAIHLPFRAPPPYAGLFGDAPDSAGLRQVQSFVVIPAELQSFDPEETPHVLALYDAQLRQFDDFWASIESTLATRGLEDKTVVVITADHGEELLEHGLVGHASTTLHARLYDEILRIPLILRVPGHRLSSPSCQVSQIDVVPTIASLLGIDPPADTEGRDLTAWMTGGPCEERPLFAESIGGGFQSRGESARRFVRAVRTPEWKLIVEFGPDTELGVELYDLQTDGREKTNSAEARPDVTTRLRALLDEYLAAHGDPDRWQRDLVETSPGRNTATEVAAAPRILSPPEEARFTFEDGAVIGGHWTGSPTATYVLEYNIGEGTELHTQGSFKVKGTEFFFGPIAPDLWGDLVQAGTWRFRVYPELDASKASAWRTFYVEPRSE